MRFTAAILFAAHLAFAGCATLRPMHALGGGGDDDHNSTTALDAAFSPDGRYVAAGDTNGDVRVWDVETGCELARAVDFASRHQASFRSRRVLFSGDGALLLYAAADGGVRVWDWRCGRTVRDLTGHAHPPTHIAVTPDDRVVAISGGFGYVREVPSAFAPKHAREPLLVITWDLATGKSISRWSDDHSGVFNATLSPDGTRVATNGAPGLPREFKDMPKDAVFHPEIIVRDAATGRPLAREGTATVTNDVRFSPDARLLATSNQAGVLRDSTTLAPLRALPFGQPTFSRDGTRVAAARDATKAFAMSPLYFIGLPIPPPPKPTLRLGLVDVATGRSLVSRDVRTTAPTSALAWNGELTMFVDRRLRLWKVPR